MSQKQGILSVQFMSMISLGICVVLKTSTISKALQSVVSVVVLLMLWIPISILIKKKHALVSAFTAVLCSISVGTLSVWSMERYASFFHNNETSLDVLFLLFLVPMMVAQSHASKKQSKLNYLAILGGFTILMIIFGLVREVFGLRSFFSYNLSHIIPFNVWILRHPSGIAFILSIGLSVLVFLNRKYKKPSFQLVLEPQSHIYQGLPRFRSQSEIYLWKGASAFIAVSVIAGLLAAGLNSGIYFPEEYFDWVPLVIVAVQIILIFIVFIISKGVRGLMEDWKIVSFVIPFQALITLLPLYHSFLDDAYHFSRLIYLVSYLVFVSAGAILIIILLLFIRAIKQKMLFGSRPNSFDGIPLFFAMTGMVLIIIYGFWPAIQHVFSTIASMG